MFAVVRAGGHQYRVSQGDVIVSEKIEAEPGSRIALEVLLVSDDEKTTVGSPLVANASVEADVLEQRRGEKIKVFKKRRRQNYRRTNGHRQYETVLRVAGVTYEG